MNTFALDLAASFAVGGIWVTLASLAAQRFGGLIGGFIAGFPSTAVLSIGFITYSQGARHGFDSAGVLPLAISINAVFLAAFAVGSRKSFAAGLLAALGIWLAAQTILLCCHPVAFWSGVGVGILLFLASLSVVTRLRIPDPGRGPVQHDARSVAARALCGGTFIGLALLGARFGGPAVGAILSAAPSTVVATLIITNAYGCRDLTRVMARPMMISGIVNCMVFALTYRHVVLQLPFPAALACAVAVTLISAAGTFYWTNTPSIHEAAKVTEETI